MGHLASSRGFCDKPVLFFHSAYVYPFSCNLYSETLYINDIYMYVHHHCPWITVLPTAAHHELTLVHIQRV